MEKRAIMEQIRQVDKWIADTEIYGDPDSLGYDEALKHYYELKEQLIQQYHNPPRGWK